MLVILSRASCFIGIILMGFILRRTGFFQESDFHVLVKVTMKITLTCAIINSFIGREVDVGMLIFAVLGLIFALFMVFVGWLINIGKGRNRQSFSMLNIAGTNLGNFVLPFAQGFLGPVGVMAVSLFDMGNSIMCLGGAYAIASMVKNGGSGESGFTLRPLFRSLKSAVALHTYVIMTVITLLHIPVPGIVADFTKNIANANIFMAMLMIGVGFQLSGDTEQMKAVARLLGIRFAIGISLALVSWYLIPVPLEYRQALVLLFMAPVSSAAVGYTADLGEDFGLASAVNSFSILISLILITGSLFLIL